MNTYLLYRPYSLTSDRASLTMLLHSARSSAQLLQFSTQSCSRFTTCSFHRRLGLPFLLFCLTSHLNTSLAGAPSSIRTAYVDALYYINNVIELKQLSVVSCPVPAKFLNKLAKNSEKNTSDHSHFLMLCFFF